MYFYPAGNYKSFGDSKFVPELSKEEFAAVMRASAAYKAEGEWLEGVWATCNAEMYDLSPRARGLGLGEEGLTTYFSEGCDKEDALLLQRFLDGQGLSAYNSRASKRQEEQEGGGKHTHYHVLLASAEGEGSPLGAQEAAESGMQALGGRFPFEGCTISVGRGDHAPLLSRVVQRLQ